MGKQRTHAQEARADSALVVLAFEGLVTRMALHALWHRAGDINGADAEEKFNEALIHWAQDISKSVSDSIHTCAANPKEQFPPVVVLHASRLLIDTIPELQEAGAVINTMVEEFIDRVHARQAEAAEATADILRPFTNPR